MLAWIGFLMIGYGPRKLDSPFSLKGILSLVREYWRICWPIAGTKCPTGARGTHAQEIKDCESCKFFHSVVYAGMTDS